jgi:NAD-dependent SIR2 family protein deacetylase
MRKNPYTKAWIQRQKCHRCGKQASEQWYLKTEGNYIPVCRDCDILILELIMRYLDIPNWDLKISIYEDRLNGIIHSTKKDKKDGRENLLIRKDKTRFKVLKRKDGLLSVNHITCY